MLAAAQRSTISPLAFTRMKTDEKEALRSRGLLFARMPAAAERSTISPSPQAVERQSESVTCKTKLLIFVFKSVQKRDKTDFSLLYLRDDHRNVVYEHVDGNGQQNHAEEFAEDEDEVRTKQPLDFVKITDDHIVQSDIQQ